MTETANRDIWLVGRDGETRSFIATDANENAAAISPDGSWIAYQSDESGRDEVYPQPFPELGRRILVSNNGGRAPVWARSGDELFYRQGTAVMSVPIDRSAGLGVGKPVLLFDGPYQADNTGHPSYDVSPDGERFLMVRQTGVVPTELNVILNVQAELARTEKGNRPLRSSLFCMRSKVPVPLFSDQVCKETRRAGILASCR